MVHMSSPFVWFGLVAFFLRSSLSLDTQSA